MEIDKRRSLNLLMKLLNIDGVSGKEEKVARFVENTAKEAGVENSWIMRDVAHKKSAYKGETGNVIITLPGNIKAPRIMFSGHIDTVEMALGSIPIRKGNYLYSKNNTALGADNKAGVAILLNTIITILERKLPHPPLTFLFTVQEEIGLLGARYVTKANLKNPSGCYNFDGTEPEALILQGPSSIIFTIIIKGRSAHAGICPEHGISAALIFAKALSRVEKKDLFGEIRRRGRKIGTSNIGIIKGGNNFNIVMDELVIKGEARSYNETVLKEIVDFYKMSFQDEARSLKNVYGKRGEILFKQEYAYKGFTIPKNTPIVKKIVKALKAMGLKPTYPRVYSGLDANWINAYGIPTVSLGAGWVNPHTTEEKLDMSHFYNGCRIALMLATDSKPQEGLRRPHVITAANKHMK